MTSVLYEHQIEKGVKLALSGQFDAKDFDKGARDGASLEISLVKFCPLGGLLAFVDNSCWIPSVVVDTAPRSLKRMRW